MHLFEQWALYERPQKPQKRVRKAHHYIIQLYTRPRTFCAERALDDTFVVGEQGPLLITAVVNVKTTGEHTHAHAQPPPNH